MEVDHVHTGGVKNERNINSIFTLFSNLTGEQNQNPKYFVQLLKTLSGNQIPLGGTDDFKYSIKRIVKSLGSTRLHSQCGCFATLVCLLKCGVCNVEDVTSALAKDEQNARDATKSEVRALNLEVVLACGAIIHSGLFAGLDIPTQSFLLKKLIDCGKKKSYLFTIACTFIIDAIYLTDRETSFNECIWPICQVEILNDLKSCNIDSYHLLTVCKTRNPCIVDKFIKRQYQSINSFVEHLTKYMFSHAVKSTHPIYANLAVLLCQNVETLKRSWAFCIEEYGKINNVKDNLLVSLFYHIMKCLKEANVVPLLLAPKFIDILITVLNFKKTKIIKDDCHQSMARDALNSIEVLLRDEKSSDELKIATIKKLLLYPANLKFELKTGNKIIQRLILQLSSESTVGMLQLYQQIITGNLKKLGTKEDCEENWNNREKQIALHNLVKTINHPSLKNDVEVKLNQIKFIFEVAFLKKNESLSDFKKYAQECFYKAIMLQMPTLRDLVFLLNRLAEHVNEHINEGNTEMTDGARYWWNKQFAALQKLQRESDNKFFITVHILLAYMGFQLFTDETLAKGSIDELLSCYLHLKKYEKKGRRCENRKSTDSEEPHWTEVTVDLILSLLSRENKLWRHVISRIFPQMVVHATPAALQQIIEALDPESRGSVLEEIDFEDGSEEESTESEATDSEESDPEDWEDREGEKVNDQLRMAVREALGRSAGLSDDESVDMDLMNEEEEKRLNESLAEAFRLYKGSSRGKRKKQTKEEEALMHFRLRVLDLIEIYVTNMPSMRECLNLILPLLNVLEFSIKDGHQSPLRSRVESVLKSVFSVKNFSTVAEVGGKQIQDLFRAVIDRKDVSALVFVEMSPRISECATFLVRCSQCLAEGKSHLCLVPEYETLLRAFCFSGDFKLPTTTFQALFRMAWKGNFKLVKFLFDFLTDSTVRIFKKVKILELLQMFYKNEKLHGSCEEILKSELTEIETKFIEIFIDHLANCERHETRCGEKMYAAFFSQIIILINAARTNFVRHRSRRNENPPWENLVSALASSETCIGNKKTKSQLGNLAKSMGLILSEMDSKGPEAKRGKRKSCRETRDVKDDEGSEERRGQEKDEENNRAYFDKEPKKKRQKKMNSKKECRKLRDKISSEGLTVFKFSSMNLGSSTADVGSH